MAGTDGREHAAAGTPAVACPPLAARLGLNAGWNAQSARSRVVDCVEAGSPPAIGGRGRGTPKRDSPPQRRAVGGLLRRCVARNAGHPIRKCAWRGAA